MPPPTSTYRLQFRNGMDFESAAGLLGYLQALGISHIYASPVFAAVDGSTHGYDVTDPNVIEPSLGGLEGFKRFSGMVKAHGMGLILDIVPNHMAASLENPWWYSLVEWGEGSPYASYFDVDWSRRLTLPVLKHSFSDAVIEGTVCLRIDLNKGAIAVDHNGSLYPLTPRSYAFAIAGLSGDLADRLVAIVHQAKPENEKQFHQEVREILTSPSAVELVAYLDKKSEEPEFLQALHALQPWQMIPWADAASDISYRRFFEIAGLVGTRVETPAVFDGMHETILRLVKEGWVQGLRVDHVDGLADPGAYLNRLRSAVGPEVVLLVEKILARGEDLPPEWPVEGSTGYEFMAAIVPVICDEVGTAVLLQGYDALHSQGHDIQGQLRAAKLQMIRRNFAGEVRSLIRLAGSLLGGSPKDVASAVEEILIAFPRYRIYGGCEPATERDADLLEQVVVEASGRLDAAGAAAAKNLLDLLISPKAAADLQTEDLGRLRLKFQQLTGPLMAKSVEDTLFFRYHPLLALNEVGGELVPELGVDTFHAAMSHRAKTQPLGLSATATHDTKRGEDARARLYVLSENGVDFPALFARWRSMNADLVQELPDGVAPEPEAEWMIYQSILGHWPVGLDVDDQEGVVAFADRLCGYLEKSAREAKLRSDWNAPNLTYEATLTDYARDILVNRPAFLHDFVKTTRPLIRAGLINSLTQLAIKLTAPGIPDIYQGTEAIDLSFVDPDNRRLPSFDTFAEVSAKPAMAFDDPQALERGGLKQQLLTAGLQLRQRRPSLFLSGGYRPIAIEGSRAHHVLAFARETETDAVVTVGVRLPYQLEVQAAGLESRQFWGDTTLVLPTAPSQFDFEDVLTGRVVERSARILVRDILDRQTVSILASRDR